MKILILVFYYSPDLSAGSFKNLALVNELSKQIGENNSIEVITTHPSRYASFKQNAADIDKMGNVTIRRIRLPLLGGGFLGQAFDFLFYAINVISLARKERYDLVYASSSRLMTASLGALVSTMQKAAYYVDIRDIFVDTIHEVFPARYTFFLRPILTMVERMTLLQASKINLVSAGFANYFSKRYPNIDKSFHTNGIDSQFLDPMLFAQIEKRKPGNPLVLVYAGNFGDGQGLHDIVPNLAKALEGRAVFRLIGDGRRRSDLKRILDTVNLANVEVVPPVNREDLQQYYSDADILFLHLNKGDAFTRVLPSKLFEYAAMGKPILAGVSGFPEQFIRDNIRNAATFLPGDHIGALNAIKRLELKSVSREEFCKKFSRKNIVKNMASDIIHTAMSYKLSALK